MSSKLHLFSKKFNKFSEFIAEASAWELEHIILSGEFTKGFSTKVREIIDELDPMKRELMALGIVFNTEGDIAIIDEALVGRFIGDRYKTYMEELYKSNLDKVIKNVIKGGEKAQCDFLSISFDGIYQCLNLLYKNIRAKKEVIDGFKKRFNISAYNNDDNCAVIGTLMIIEDISKYINNGEKCITNLIDEKFSKKFSQYVYRIDKI